MPQMNPLRTTVQEATDYSIRLLGTGAANPTKQEGEGVVVTRTGPGVFRVQFAENPFQFIGAFGNFLSNLMTDVKGWTIVFGDYDPVNYRIAFSLFNSTFAAVELAATQRVCILLKFSRSGY